MGASSRSSFSTTLTEAQTLCSEVAMRNRGQTLQAGTSWQIAGLAPGAYSLPQFLLQQDKGDLPALPARAEKMTLQQIAEAKRLISDFKRTHPPEGTQ